MQLKEAGVGDSKWFQMSKSVSVNQIIPRNLVYSNLENDVKMKLSISNGLNDTTNSDIPCWNKNSRATRNKPYFVQYLPNLNRYENDGSPRFVDFNYNKRLHDYFEKMSQSEISNAMVVVNQKNQSKILFFAQLFTKNNYFMIFPFNI